MQSRIQQLKGRKALLINQKEEALARFDHVSAKIDLAEQAKPFFKQLKDVTDQNAITLYSDLLTSIVHDVMQQYDQRVELTTDVVRGKTTLNINTIKAGNNESIDDGRGGSIANLIAAGLRFISLYKSSNRRFALLDEAECWLEPHLIPRFVSVIERLSDTIGIQTVMISHHASDVVTSENSVIVTLAVNKTGQLQAKLQENKIVASGSGSASAITMAGNDADYAALVCGVGIKSLHLLNVQSHRDTLIPLSSGLTVINGANDIGKSAIARTFKAFLENDFRQDLISHDADQLSFTVCAEQDNKIVWTFSRKAKMSLYQFYSAAGELLQEEEAEKGALPTFVDEVLSMGNVMGINLHIADQKDPLFILHPSISPSERAEMLNLGEDFRKLQLMMQINADEIREDKRELKTIKEQVNEANDALHYLSPLDTVEEACCASELQVVDDVASYAFLTEQLTNVFVWENHQSALSLMQKALERSESDIESEYADLVGTLIMGEQLASNEGAISMVSQLLINSETLTACDEHQDVFNLLQLNACEQDHAELMEKVRLTLSNTLMINTVANDFDFNHHSSLLNELESGEIEINELNAKLDKLLELQSKFAVCGQCGQPINKHDEHHIDDEHFQNVTSIKKPVLATQSRTAVLF